MKVREYKGPLTVLTAGTIGFSLFCIVSVLALAGADEAHPVEIQPQNIVDSAFSNLSTVAALTVEVIAEYIDTVTAVPTDTLSVRPASNGTPTLIIPLTSNQSTRTRIPRDPFGVSRTPTRVPTGTPSRIPSTTPSRIPTVTPSLTDTPIPPPTFTRTLEPSETPVPDTDTPVPTDTPEPPTETPEPDTDTPVPPPTDTDIPPTEVTP